MPSPLRRRQGGKLRELCSSTDFLSREKCGQKITVSDPEWARQALDCFRKKELSSLARFPPGIGFVVVLLGRHYAQRNIRNFFSKDLSGAVSVVTGCDHRVILNSALLEYRGKENCFITRRVAVVGEWLEPGAVTTILHCEIDGDVGFTLSVDRMRATHPCRVCVSGSDEIAGFENSVTGRSASRNDDGSGFMRRIGMDEQSAKRGQDWCGEKESNDEEKEKSNKNPPQTTTSRRNRIRDDRPSLTGGKDAPLPLRRLR